MNSLRKSTITPSGEQQEALDYIRNGRNVLITGSAGTGKSTILKKLAEESEIEVAASTGISAVNVGGMTINSWAGLGLGDREPEDIAKDLLDGRTRACKRILKAKRLAIDEVSMIHANLFELTDKVFRLVRKADVPFGGIQLILFGDFLQLPPVSKERFGKIFAFQSQAWRDAKIKVQMLTQVFRQEDAEFSSALNNVRIGNLTPDVLRILRSRYRAQDTKEGISPVIVYTHNADVEAVNNRKLDEMEGKPKVFESIDEGEPGPLETIRKNCLAPAELRLKVGAQVMLLKNVNPLDGLANGSIGKVVSFQPETGMPVVKFQRGGILTMEVHTWEIKAGDDVLASRTQIPLRLAWAITAHKSQGMTLDKIQVHLDKAFEYGQAYVALSRSRTLEGLFIESTKRGCIKAHPDAVNFYTRATLAAAIDRAENEG